MVPTLSDDEERDTEELHDTSGLECDSHCYQLTPSPALFHTLFSGQKLLSDLNLRLTKPVMQNPC